VVLETREPLGALSWGYKIRDQSNSAVELLGGTAADCKDAPSAEWGKTLDQFSAGKFATMLDGFEVDKADLSPAHHALLDGIAAKLKADTAIKVQLGGAGDLTEQQSTALSLKRAENARDYLIGKGVATGRIEIQSYGSDWARVEAQHNVAEGKNRRIQVWLHK
jgi:outer membrane protein OmpA-like peptidoglycan-associated protein